MVSKAFLESSSRFRLFCWDTPSRYFSTGMRTPAHSTFSVMFLMPDSRGESSSGERLRKVSPASDMALRAAS